MEPARFPRGLLGLRSLPEVPAMPSHSRVMAHVPAAVLCAIAVWGVTAVIEKALTSHTFRLGTETWMYLMMFWLLSEPAAFALGALMTHRALRHWQVEHRLDDLVLTPLRPVQIGHILLSHALRPMLRMVLIALIGLLAWLFLSVTSRLVLSDVMVLAAGLTLLTLNTRLALLTGAWSQANLSLAMPGALRPLWAQLNHLAVQVLLLFAPLLLLAVSAAVISDFGTSTRDWSPLFLGPVILAAPLHWTIMVLAIRGWVRCLERTTFPGVSW